MKSDVDYLQHLAEESARFGEVFHDLPPDTQVPACPDWNADDLLWHLGEVQWFWGTAVRENVTGSQAEQMKPPRPDDRAGLLAFYRSASAELGLVLAAASPETPAWTWSKDQSVGFIQRKQAHEALIHRVDAEEAAGRRTAMDPVLCADGVDEALRVMYGGLPDWGTFTPDPDRLIRLQATDTGDSWLAVLGRFTGTDPDGTSYDEPDFHVEDGDLGRNPDLNPDHRAEIASINATAADLDCWLWHRTPLGPVELSGDEAALRDFQSIIAPGLD